MKKNTKKALTNYTFGDIISLVEKATEEVVAEDVTEVAEEVAVEEVAETEFAKGEEEEKKEEGDEEKKCSECGKPLDECTCDKEDEKEEDKKKYESGVELHYIKDGLYKSGKYSVQCNFYARYRAKPENHNTDPVYITAKPYYIDVNGKKVECPKSEFVNLYYPYERKGGPVTAENNVYIDEL